MGNIMAEAHPIEIFDSDDDQEDDHPIFREITNGNLEVVEQRVLADGTVLEERWVAVRWTPLMCAISWKKPAIGLFLITRRGHHDLEAANANGWTAMHHASRLGLLEIVQALVAAGANPAARTGRGSTPLIMASAHGHTDIVAFLLQLPAATASIDHDSLAYRTALSWALYSGHQPIMQLLLDAGADHTIPAGPDSPLNQAVTENHRAIAALLRHAIAEPDRARALHKACCLLGAGAASLASLQGRVEQGEALPQVELTTAQQQGDERLRGAFASALGLSGGEKDNGLCEELYFELLGYMLPAWAEKGPEAEDDDLEEEEEGDWGPDSEDDDSDESEKEKED